MQRIIGKYKGPETSGPLLVVTAAVHGNEPAGVKALQSVFEMLEAQRPEFKGTMVGMIGNLQAYQQAMRFIDRDLNRAWIPEQIQRILHADPEHLAAEDREIKALIQLFHELLEAHRPEALILLDLHTTSADGGIFCIPSDDKAALRLAKALHAPVILHLFEGIEGPLLRYAVDGHFNYTAYAPKTIGVAFEAGQHEDPAAVQRAIAVIIHCLRAVGCIEEDALPNRQEQILDAYSRALPKVSSLQYAHHIRPGDAFKMRAGYSNFQKIKRGEHLADDVCGPINSEQDGMILMPLYQSKGSEGFFVIKEVFG